MNKQTIEILKTKRKKDKITQESIANKLNLKKNTISNYETGVCEPSIDNFILLCQAYGLDPREVIAKSYNLHNMNNEQISLDEDTKNLIKTYNSLDNHGKNSVLTVAKSESKRVTSMRSDLKKYINTPISARSGGVTLADEKEAEELTALECFLKDQGII